MCFRRIWQLEQRLKRFALRTPGSVCLVDDPDMEHLIIDSTVVAHPSAAGASKKPEGNYRKPSGAAEVGCTNVHVGVDGLGTR